MIAALKSSWDALWGRGEHAVTVPSLDGALRPNARLDEAVVLAELPGADCLAAHATRLFASQGEALLARDGAGGFAVVTSFDAPISALAAAADGTLAVGLDDGTLLRLDPVGTKSEPISVATEQGSITALAFAPDGALHACLGSARHKASEWKRDLMLHGRSGAVFRIAPGASSAERIATGLAFPTGIAFDQAGAPIVSEAWRHRLVRLGHGHAGQPVLWDMPGYPGRLSPAADGGYWLSVFAPRSQMTEFVLREKVYRERMVADIPEDFWMAPTLRAGRSFKEPLQGGGVKHLGIHKPWGPTRSYGLVVRLDEAFQPISSHHSRSDGHRHGITDITVWNGVTVAASKGDGLLMVIEDDEPMVQQ